MSAANPWVRSTSGTMPMISSDRPAALIAATSVLARGKLGRCPSNAAVAMRPNIAGTRTM